MSNTLQDDWVEKVIGVQVSRSTPMLVKGGGGAQETSGKGRGEGKGVFAALKGKLFRPKPPPKPAAAGTVQTARAQKLLKAMPEQDREKIQKILDDAPAEEKGYLLKAVASKHSATEIENFQKQIAGKDAKWLAEQLHVVGQSSGKGIKQQWSDSCGPTTIQAMKAELDPIYALKLRKDNPNFMKVDAKDGEKLNKPMAEDQKKVLEKSSGVAASRDGSGGVGMMLETALSDQQSATGLKFKYSKVDDKDIDSSLKKMNDSIKAGLPVPLGVTDHSRKGGHWVLLVGIEDKGKEKVYSIHDPWDGKMVKVTEAQLKKGTFNIAGWNRLDDLYTPSAE